MKVLIFVCGEGLGHTGRCMALARALSEAGHDVCMGAYGYSKEAMIKKGFSVVDLPAEIRLVGDAGTFSLKKSIVSTLKSGSALGIFKNFRLLRKTKPDIVVSDSYFTGAVAAMLMRFPVTMIVNQSNMEAFFENGGFLLGMLGRAAKLFYGAVFRSVRRIVIPDFPMPDTICRLNLAFGKKASERLFFCGPLSLEKPENVTAASLPKPHVLSLIGGFGYRAPIFRKVIEAARLDAGIRYTLLSGPNLDPNAFPDLPENVTLLRFIDDQFPYLKAADLVIAPGGHSTMMEAMTFGIPVISFPDISHSEQESNASALEENGCGLRLGYDAAPKDILAAVEKILTDDTFRRNAADLKARASTLRPAETLVRILETDLQKT